MKLIYHENTLLPELAWCAVAKKEKSEIHVYHGKSVETFDDFFVEGVWNDDFGSGSFHKSEYFIGTGAVSVKSGLGGAVFATPNHTLERLYSISEDDVIYISNSLPYI